MQPTNIKDPEYFHKVVDCQYACPAHTPVPEYIRLIAAGKYTEAYMINWESNVFPGVLGRTCDRPCEPACRRGRVEDEPVAICRLKRTAADHKDDIHHLLPRVPEQKNGRRIALVGAGPGLAHGGPRPGPAGLRNPPVRQPHERRRHDAQPNPLLPPARIRAGRRGRLYPRHGHHHPFQPLRVQHARPALAGLRRDFCRHGRTARA